MGTIQFTGFNELAHVFESAELIHLFAGDNSHLNQVSFLVTQDGCHQTTTFAANDLGRLPRLPSQAVTSLCEDASFLN